MKICPKCGAVLKDSYRFCLDCEAELGASLSPEEEAAYEKKMGKRLTELVEQEDDFHVGKRQIINAVLQGTGILVCLWRIIFYNDDASGYEIFAIILFALGGFLALFPKIDWKLTQFHLQFTVDGADSLGPSFWYVFGRKISIWLLWGCGVLTIALPIFHSVK